MVATIKLIATDLDGTLIGNADEMPVYSEFAARMRGFRASTGTVWVVMSGRSLRSFMEYSEPLRNVGLLPDYAVLRYTLIYRREGEGYRLCWGWSAHTLWQRIIRPSVTRRVLRDWRAASISGYRGTRTLTKSPERLQLRFKSEESAATAAAALNERLAGLDHVQVVVDGSTVDVRTFLYLKGLSLKALERRLGIEPETVLAIGNGYHDLSMLNARIARMIGCPSNSHARVIERVTQAGGHVARQRALAGVLEILNAYMTDSVDSSAPSFWRPPGSLRQGGAVAESRRAQVQKQVFRWAALGAVSYIILLAVASIDILPYSWIVMKPFDMAVRLVHHVISWF
jgi:hydroxymethylpyrimidine pyrophosphatase-like HAD family hydrolase